MDRHTPSLTASLVLASLLGLTGTPAIAQTSTSELLVAQSSDSPFQTPDVSAGRPLTQSIVHTTPPAYTVLYVNSTAGSDYGNGSQMQPFRTITHALSVAQPNTIVLLTPGVYSAASGESFPIRLKPGVTVQGGLGPSGNLSIIYGEGTIVSPTQAVQHVTVLAADRSGLGHVTISNPHAQGHGVWIEAGSPVLLENSFINNGFAGVYIAGAGAPTIQGNYFAKNGQAGLVIGSGSEAMVQGNRFEDTGIGISVAPNAAPQLINNEIVRNQDGLMVAANARPVLSNNQISQNRRNGVIDIGTSAATPPAIAAAAVPAAATPAMRTAATDTPSMASTSPAVPPAATAASRTTLPNIANTLPNIAMNPVVAPPASPPASTSATLPGVSASASPANLGSSPAATTIDPVAPTSALPHLPSISSSGSSVGAAESSTLPDLPTRAQSIPSTPQTATAQAVAPEPPSQEVVSPASEPQAVAIAVIPAPTELTPSITPQATPSAPPSSSSAEDRAQLVARLRSARERNASVAAQPTVVQPTPSSEPQGVEIRVIPPPTEAVATIQPPDQPQSSGSVELPVVVARSASSPSPAAATPTAALPTAGGGSLPSLPSNILQVPSMDIPVGRGGGGTLPAVPVVAAGGDLPQGGPPAPPSRASMLGLYYRVFVDANDDVTQTQVRNLVPDAFRTRVEGRVVMQAGAYADEASAQEKVNFLASNGIAARVEYIP